MSWILFLGFLLEWRRLSARVGSATRKWLSSLAELSILQTLDPPHSLQRQRWEPEEVFPLRFKGVPHAGHFIMFMPSA